MHTRKPLVSVLLREIGSGLLEMGIESGPAEAEIILSEVMTRPPGQIHLERDLVVEPAALARVRRIVARRSSGEPLQYILGKAWFRGLCLKVGPGVLIPRPETELILDYAEAFLVPGAVLCDLGAGSGAIALAAAREFPAISVLGLDISPIALDYAEANRVRLGLDNVRFCRSDLFAAVPGRAFDLILSNPPYVSEAEFARLPGEVRGFEPPEALLGGRDGLTCIRKIIRQAPEFLRKNGALILEIGETQGNLVPDVVEATDSYRDVSIKKDLNNRDRFIFAHKNG